MRDRLEHLRSLSPSTTSVSTGHEADVESEINDIVTGNTNNDQEQAEKKDPHTAFFDAIEHIRQNIKAAESLIDSIDRQHRLSLSTIKQSEVDRADAEGNRLTDQFTTKCDQIRQEIKRLTVETKDRRLQMTLQTVTKRFLQVARMFEAQVVRHRQASRMLIKQRLRVLKPNLTGVELERLADSPSIRQDERIYSPILSQSRLDEHKKLAEGERDWMAARQSEMHRLEQSIRELASLMQDISLMISQQGDAIDRVESYVGSAEEYGEKSKRELTQAAKTAKKRQQQRLVCIVGLAITLVIVLLVSVLLIKLQILNPLMVIGIVLMIAVVAGGVYWLYRKCSPRRWFGFGSSKEEDEVDAVCCC